MSTCAIQYSKNFNEDDNEWEMDCTPTLPRRGICSRCYNQLVRDGVIIEGENFPDWLNEAIRMQDRADHFEDRHPEECSEEMMEWFLSQ